MAFKLYQDKSSLNYKNSRMVAGGTTTVVNPNFLGWWEKREFISDVSDEQFIVTKQTEFRADKISYILYGRNDYDWLILQYNNIVDINEELTAGTILTVPSRDRALYSMTND